MKEITDNIAVVCFVAMAVLIIAAIAFNFSGCVHVDEAVVEAPVGPSIEWATLMDGAELVLGPEDEVRVQVQLSTLKRALLVAEQWDAVQALWPSIATYIEALEAGYKGLELQLARERAQREWNAWVGAGVGTTAGVLFGVLAGLLMGAGQ